MFCDYESTVKVINQLHKEMDTLRARIYTLECESAHYLAKYAGGYTNTYRVPLIATVKKILDYLGLKEEYKSGVPETTKFTKIKRKP